MLAIILFFCDLSHSSLLSRGCQKNPSHGLDQDSCLDTLTNQCSSVSFLDWFPFFYWCENEFFLNRGC